MNSDQAVTKSLHVRAENHGQLRGLWIRVERQNKNLSLIFKAQANVWVKSSFPWKIRKFKPESWEYDED